MHVSLQQSALSCSFQFGDTVSLQDDYWVIALGQTWGKALRTQTLGQKSPIVIELTVGRGKKGTRNEKGMRICSYINVYVYTFTAYIV